MRHIKKEVEIMIEAAIIESQIEGTLPEFDVPSVKVIENSWKERKKKGDFSWPMFEIAKLAKMKPMEVGEIIRGNILRYNEEVDGE